MPDMDFPFLMDEERGTAAMDRVEQLHRPVDVTFSDTPMCRECLLVARMATGGNNPVAGGYPTWPCTTIRTLRQGN